MKVPHFRWPLLGLGVVLALVVVTSAAFAAGATPSGLPTPAAPQATNHVGSGESAKESSEPKAAETAEAKDMDHRAVFGSVTALGNGTVTIKKMDGKTQTIDLTGSTVYLQGGAKVTRSALVVGANVLVKGTVDSKGTLTATIVRVVPSVVIGTVTALTSDTIVVKTLAGKSVTIDVNSETKYLVDDSSSATLASLKVGERIVAFGTMGSKGALTASFVAGNDTDHGFPGLGGFFGNRGMGGNGGEGGFHFSFPFHPSFSMPRF